MLSAEQLPSAPSRTKTWIRLSRLLFVPLLISLACSGGDPAPTAPEPDQYAKESQWAIHAYVGPNRVPIDIPPVLAQSVPNASDAGVPSSGKAPLAEAPAGASSRSPLGTYRRGGRTFDFDQSDLTQSGGWTLVKAAAMQCGAFELDNPVPPGEVSQPAFLRQNLPIAPPWKPFPVNGVDVQPWYVFLSGEPSNCDMALAYEQIMLCIAQNLSEVADTVKPLVWDRVHFIGNPWVIPPQRDADRFIARDLALNALANLAYTDLTSIGTFNNTCLDQYSSVVAGTASSIDIQNTFGKTSGTSDYFPFEPHLDIAADGANLARTRLEAMAHILNNATRLARDLTRKSVFSDLAGTEKRRALATDPLKANKIAWGLADTANGPYNSLVHAVRVVSGRLDMGPAFPINSFFPQGAGLTEECAKRVPPLGLLSDTYYGSDFRARFRDLPPTTEGQQKAVTLLESAGILVKPSIADQHTPEEIRAGVTAQLVAQAALQQGLAIDDPTFLAGELARAIRTATLKIKDADLRFALEHNWINFLLLNPTPDEDSVFLGAMGGVKLRRVEETAPELGDVLHGGAVVGGLPVFDLGIDFTARAGKFQIASLCSDGSGIGIATVNRAVPFQDVFSLGQSLGRRLTKIREVAKNLQATDVSEFAAQAVAEVRGWSGSGFIGVIAQLEDPTTSPPAVGTFAVDITVLAQGFAPSDWGVTTAEEMANEISFVTGPSWVADCAAGIRTTCPETFNDYYVAHPIGSVSPPSVFDAEQFGADGPQLTFRLTANPGGHNYPTIYFQPQVQFPMYVIGKHDPSNPGKGRVLATVTFGENGQTLWAPVSNMQRELLNGIVGFDQRTADCAVGATGSSSARSPSYCIDGVPRDMFVPLENELTSDSDQFENSWRHYLTLAKQAAQKADELGQKLIDQGLQIDLRREAAGESVAQICGGYGSLDKVTFDKGKAQAGKGDEGLAACLGEDKFGVVLLTNDPFSPESTTGIKSDVLHCDTGGPTDLCGKTDTPAMGGKPAVPGFTHAGLNLAKRPDPDTGPTMPSPNECDDAAKALLSLRTGFESERLAKYPLQSWATRDNMRISNSQFSLDVAQFNDGDTQHIGDWRLTVGGTPVMDSRSTALWPGCHRTMAGCTEPRAATFDSLFRKGIGALGSVDGGGTGNGEMQANHEANVILWRVEGALWLMSALGDQTPQGMFNVLLPAADFAAGLAQAPFPTVYGDGRFELEGQFYQLKNEDDPDRELFGKGAIEGPGVFAWPAGGEVPPWLSNISNTALYRYFRGANSEYQQNQHPAGVAQLVGDAIAGFRGALCSEGSTVRFTGEPSRADNRDKLAQALQTVSGLKVGPNWGLISVDNDGFPIATVFPDGHGDVGWDLNTWLGGPTSLSTDGAFFLPLFGKDSLDYSVSQGPGNIPPQDDCLTNQGALFAPFLIPGACAQDNVELRIGEFRYVRRFLLPQLSTPSKRTQLFVNSYPHTGSCGAAAELARALALACLQSNSTIFPVQLEIPSITKPEDIGGLERWIGTLGNKAQQQLTKLYIRNLPKRVVEDINGQTVGKGNLQGTHGQIILDMESNINQLVGIWQRVSGDLAEIGSAVGAARIGIQGASIEEQQAQANLIIEELGIYKDMAKAAASVFTSLNPIQFVDEPLTILSAAVDIGLGVGQISQIGVLKGLADQKQQNEVAKALNQLQGTTIPLFVDIQKGLGDLRSALAQILSGTTKLQSAEDQAAYEVGKAAGHDFVVGPDGKPVAMPVNSVLRRQYNVTEIRYRRALEDAKRLAYIARLAIEQRIGSRLSTLTTRIGALDPPAQWADDVCSLTGIDYKRFRSAGDASPGFFEDPTPEELSVINDLANQWVGDYVTKLENFVEYYNIQYPSHDGDDTAVLSLRDDLLPAPAACLVQAPNLLLYSSRLTEFDLVTQDKTTTRRGWSTASCGPTDTKCLRVLHSFGLHAPADPPVLGSSVTWLKEEAASPPSGAVQPSGGLTDPTNTVWQVVHLPVGNYQLSWWDQARDPAGNFVTSGAPSYRAGVFDTNWSQVAGGAYDPSPAPAADAGVPNTGAPIAELWSARRTVEFTVGREGDYRVAFGASPVGGARGSVAIAGVQLEFTAKPGAGPTAYVETHSTRQVKSAACGLRTPQEVQAAFKHDCDENGNCFYELATPILVDTSTLGTARSRLNGRLSAGNFNFRHIDVALNLVGTGVRDCQADPVPSCFGSGYLDYTLVHDAFQSGISDRNGAVQCFNFGSGAINHGKALTAERFITVPIGSADANLLQQSGITKPEFRGRPLDGSYKLRIWDTPSLAWNRVEDVQIVLKYRYWSSIQSQPGN
jgi:hypothetical protein